MKELRIKFRWETEFKETEIGEIPREWEVKKLGDLLRSLESGSRPKGGSLAHTPNGVLSIGGENINRDGSLNLAECLRFEESFYNRLKRGRIEEGDILLVKDGATIGKLAFIKKVPEGKAMVNEHVFLLKSNNLKINPKLLFYFLFSEGGQQQIESLIFGSAQGGINKSIQDNILVFYPPLPEQSRIATVLSWFDDLIEVKKRQNEILEKIAMAIFKSWFVDFEPFRDGEFVYSEELGKEIPKGWEVDKTIRLIDYNPSVSIEEGKVFPFVEMKDVSTNSLACDFSFKTFTGSGVKYFGGDTLMARITPSLEHGKTAFVWFISEKENGFGSTEFFVLHPKKSYLKEFVYLLAKSNDFREVAINSMSGTSGRQRADINALKNYLIPIPPSHILQSFHSLVEPLFQKIILNQKQIMTLRKIRDTLLPLLVFGKLRVEEV
jgi:type I restriction enzyme S subunit